MASTQERSLREAEELYERYAKLLEAEHRGKYVAIAPDGQTVIGETVAGVLVEAERTIGPGNMIFHIGRRWVWKTR
jgi:hypothetical protein